MAPNRPAEVFVAASVVPNAELNTAAVPVRWNAFLRVGFRFCFLYFLIWIFLNGNATIWRAVPAIGGPLESGAHFPAITLANWLAPHLFHVTGVGAHSHPTGSGDTAIDWIVTGIFFTAAFIGTLAWSLLDRRRHEYQTLLAWLRFALRLSIGLSLVGYGFAKLFPLQMPPPSLKILNEPVGQLSPMALLWTFLGASPVYERICGAAEITAGVLLLVHRTALLGALVTSFVVLNVVLYNFLFDVPVKIFSLHLFMGALFIALPDYKALYLFFWKHIPAAPGGVWIPPVKRPGFRRATFIFELVFLVLVLGESALETGLGYRSVLANRSVHSPLQGAWVLQGAQNDPVLGKITEVFIGEAADATSFWASARKQDGEPAWGRLNTAKHTLNLGSASGQRTLPYTVGGPDRLNLVQSGSSEGPSLVRVPQPAQWPLLTRGFHLVSEYPYQR